MASHGPIIIALVLGIIILILVSIIIYFLVIRSTGGQEGAICRSDGDCAPGFYCGGPGRCHAGEAGGAVGAPCTINVDCQFGLLCADGICINPLLDDITDDEKLEMEEEMQDVEHELVEFTGQFLDKYLITTLGGQRYYLHLTPNHAYLSKFRANTLSYAHNTLFTQNMGRANIDRNGSILMSNNSSHVELYQLSDDKFVIFSPEKNALLRLNPADLHVQFSPRDDWVVLDFHLE